ncbi:MAG: regulatory protein RecX [Saprospiraceae bacterium]
MFDSTQNKKKKTPAQALPLMQKFCAYQDRCHQECRYKLLDYGVYGDDLEEILAALVEEDYLNEERFARSFVRGKYRMKKWGTVRIIMELKQRKISAYCQKMGLSEIDPEIYMENLQSLLSRKLELLEQEPKAQQKPKLYDYALRKGYTGSEIAEELKNLGF